MITQSCKKVTSKSSTLKSKSFSTTEVNALNTSLLSLQKKILNNKRNKCLPYSSKSTEQEKSLKKELMKFPYCLKLTIELQTSKAWIIFLVSFHVQAQEVKSYINKHSQDQIFLTLVASISTLTAFSHVLIKRM